LDRRAEDDDAAADAEADEFLLRVRFWKAGNGRMAGRGDGWRRYE
jgi:hypothetical protein